MNRELIAILYGIILAAAFTGILIGPIWLTKEEREKRGCASLLVYLGFLAALAGIVRFFES